MTRGEMRAMVRIFLRETIEDSYKDTEINTQLPISQNRVAMETRCLTTRSSLTMVAYNDPGLDPNDPNDVPLIEGRYGMPDDLLALEDIEIVDAGGYKTFPVKKPLRELVRIYSQDFGGRPCYYAASFGSTDQAGPTRGDIAFKPLPDGPYTAIVHYVQRPDAMDEDTDFSELPEFAHLAVCYHAAMTLSRKKSDRDLIIEMGSLYSDEIVRVKEMIHLQDATGPIYIRNVYKRRRY